MVLEPLFKVRPIRDLKDMLEQSADLFGEKNAFLLKDEKGEYKGIKFSEFKSEVDGLGTALISLGLKDKHIAVIGENRYEWCVAYLAVVNGTGVVVPLDKELPPAEIQTLLVRSEASAVIFSSKLYPEIESIASSLPSVKYFICMDADEDAEGFLSMKKLIEKGRRLIDSGDRSFLDAQVDNEAMNMLIFTSGTTDVSKGVMLSHKNICSNMMAVCSALYIDSNDSALSMLPLHHTYECTCGFLVMIYNGCTISFIEGLKHIAKNLKEFKPSIIMCVPLILENMYRKIWEQASKKRGMKTKLKAALFISKVLYRGLKIDLRKKIFKQIHETLGGKLRLIISGAAAIDPVVSHGFEAMGVTIRQGYGLTECSPIVTVNRDNFYRHDSIGQPLPGFQVKLVDVNSEGVGEIAVKCDSVMLGYYKNPEATEKVLKDGWLYTGDLAYMDDSCLFYVTGRKKNVIVTKNGKNIYPEEVEIYLNRSSYIQESMVYGKYDEASGETYVHAQIYPDLEAIKAKLRVSELTDETVWNVINSEIKLFNNNMPLYMRIRQFTIRENEFAKTTTRKIKRYLEKIS